MTEPGSRSHHVRIDGHLDLAFSALTKGRDLTLPLDELRRREASSAKEAMVTLPELRLAELDVVVATIFVLPSRHADQPGRYTYDADAEARSLASEQLDLYERWEEQGRLRLLRSRDDLDQHLARPRVERPPGAVVLMEGAAPVRDPSDVAHWVARGVRAIGPAWKRTRYAGGTGEPGGLSAEGRDLVDALGEHGVILDVSHLAEEAFWEALERHGGLTVASHSNARALVDSDRQLSDAMLDALAARDGLVGLVLADKFLRSGGNRSLGPGEAPVSLADVARQAQHLAGRVGWARLGVGSDFDGGFGRQETPVELDRAADFARLGEAVPAEHREGFLGGNWARFLRRALPGSR